MKKYGIPYRGSKSFIAEWIVDEILPKGERLVDLFAGGCAVTHCAMTKHKYKSHLVVDINDIPQLFIDAVNGRYRDEKRWISSDDFYRLKDNDAYVRCCWSFGNNLQDYLYGRKIEPYKKACHYAVVLDEWGMFEACCPEVCECAKNALDGISDIKERRLKFQQSIVNWIKENGTVEMVERNTLYSSIKKNKNSDFQSLESLQSLQSLQSLERLERIQSLERLERLQSLERLESLESLESLQYRRMSYEQYEHKDGDVVYADPPYETSEIIYGMDCVFDKMRFCDWVRTRDYAVFVSEYKMPDDFIAVGSRKKNTSFSATSSINKIENVFLHEKWVDEWRMKRNLLF